MLWITMKGAGANYESKDIAKDTSRKDLFLCDSVIVCRVFA